MIADIILGVNIDTEKWIKELEEAHSENIIVLDYEYYGEPKYRDNVLYISHLDAKSYFNKFHSLYFYKSLYAYPKIKKKP